MNNAPAEPILQPLAREYPRYRLKAANNKGICGLVLLPVHGPSLWGSQFERTCIIVLFGFSPLFSLNLICTALYQPAQPARKRLKEKTTQRKSAASRACDFCSGSNVYKWRCGHGAAAMTLCGHPTGSRQGTSIPVSR